MNATQTKSKPQKAGFAVFIFLVAFICTLGSSAVAASCADGLSGVAGWWPGDANGTDLTSKNPAILTNGVAIVPGLVGSAFSFDGVNDYIVVPKSASMNVGTNGGFTVEAWVNPANVGGAMPVFEWSWIPGAEVGVHVWLNQAQSGDVFANILDSVPNGHTITSPGGVVHAGVYQHVAVTYDRGSGIAKIYVNGSNVVSATLGSFIPNTDRDLLIGKRIDGGAGYVFSGQIDEPTVFGRALSGSEIQSIYLAGSSGKCALSAPQLVQNDFSSEFGNAANPNGRWSYGSKPTLGGMFALMATKGSVPGNNGAYVQYWQVAPSVEPTIFHNTNAIAVTFSGGQVAPGETYMYSGSAGETNKFGVVRYTVPSSGDYRVIASGRPVYNSAAAGQGDTDFHLVRNGVEIFGQNVPAMGLVAFSNVVNLATGDVVEIVLGPGLDGQGGYAGSGLKLDLSLAQISSSPTAPSIVTQPVGSTNTVGASATLSVLAAGSSPLAYQWFKGAASISGANDASLSLANLQLADSGGYMAVVTNSSGSVTSTVASVVVNHPPAIEANFSGAFSTRANPNGLWSYGSKPTLGGDFALMTTQGAVPGNNGAYLQYWQVAPSVEPTIFHNTNAIAVTFTGGQVAPGETYMFSGSAGETSKFGVVRYMVPESGTYTVVASARPVYDSAAAGQGDTDFHLVINGTELFGQNVPAMGQVAFSNVVNLAMGDLIELVLGPGLDGMGGHAGSGLKLDLALRQLLTQSLPVVLVHPLGSTNQIGGSAALSVLAAGSEPLTYQWRKDGQPLSGATNSSLIFGNLAVADSGTYSVVVSNALGSVTSQGAGLLVLNEASLVLPNIYEHTDDGYNSGHLDEVNTRWQTVYGADQFPQHPITIHEIRYRPSRVSGKAFSTTIQNLQINLSTSQKAPNALSRTFAENLGTDDTVVFHGAITLSSGFVSTPAGPKEFDIVIPLATPFFYNPAAGNLLLDLRNPDGSSMASRIDAGTSQSDSASRVWSRVPDLVALTGDNNAEIIQIRYSTEPTSPTAPIILVQPIGSTNDVGSSASLAVTAYGSAPLAYQWRKDGQPLAGATNSSLALLALQVNQAGSYSVVVTNALGSVTSSNALVAVVLLPPYIVVQPADQSKTVGTTAAFSVTAGGAKPLAYQWFFNGNMPLADGTNASLALTNVGPASVGDYSVVVANGLGMATSSVAKLTVSYPPALISIAGADGNAGSEISLPVTIRANGNENSLSFSLSYTPSRLQFAGVSLGSGAINGSILVNTSLTNIGRVGIAFAMDPNATFNGGTQQVVVVRFNSTSFISGAPITTTVSFTASPVPQVLTDATAATLPRTFSSPAQVLLRPSPIEGDVYPRPAGNRILDISDWVQVGRFVAGLDQAASAEEFQRIDCAPRAIRGDGQLKVTDWVQAGRYAVGLDPVTAVGGPKALVVQASAPAVGRSRVSPMSTRTLKAMNGSAVQGLTVTVPVVLEAQGDENAVGFSLSFDTNAFSYVSAAKGSAFGNGSIQINALQGDAGRVGVVAALPSGAVLPAGSAEVATVTLRAKTPEAGNYAVSLGNVPLAIGVSDALANELTAVPMAASVAVNPVPNLTALKSGGMLKLSWPTWADGFGLQSGGLGGNAWTNLSASPTTNGGSIEVVLPLSGEPAFFRLQHP